MAEATTMETLDEACSASESGRSSAALERLFAQSVLVQQGAEAKIYRGSLHLGRPVLIKHRFTKTYRHARLDATLTRARLVNESRALVRCARAGLPVPTLYLVDADENVVVMEWIEGRTMKDVLIESVRQGRPSDDDGQGPLLSRLGQLIAQMHRCDVVHGDLTTSNVMIRDTDQSAVLIDFGLAYVSNSVEDIAVDLYVLERALSSAHGDTPVDSLTPFDHVLHGYQAHLQSLDAPACKAILGRLNEVRMRGRKRSMVG